MSKPSVELTDAQKDALVGGPHGEPFPIPSEAQFDAAGLGRLDAPELAAIGARMIEREALYLLPLGHLKSRRLVYLWSKQGSTEAGKPRWGSVSLASADLKHLSLEPIESGDYGNPVDAVIRLAADHLREAEATRWQVANELCFLLFRIGVYTTQSGDDRLRMVPPDSAFFTPQMRLFGPQTPELKRTIFDIRQTRFEWADRLADDIAKAEAAKEHDPSVDQAPGVEDEIGPDPDGAPAAEWADPHDVESAAEAEVRLVDDILTPEQHAAAVRSAFPKQFRDGAESCRACGLPIAMHRVDECAGRNLSAPEKSPKNRDKANGAAHEGDSPNGNAASTDVLVASGVKSQHGTGAHAPDDFDSPNRDPEQTVKTLSQAGR